MSRFLFLFFLLPFTLSAQHQIGWRTDTYAGINSASINPAAPIRTPCKWDINLVESAQFLFNNYAFFANTSVPKLLRTANGNSQFVLATDLPDDINPDIETVVYDFYSGADTRKAFVQNTIMGPSFSVQISPRTRIGLMSQWRTMGFAKGVDSDFSYYQWNEILSQTAISIDPMEAAINSWTEVGVNIVHAIPTPNGQLAIGATIKKIWGQRAAYFRSIESFDLYKLADYDGLEGANFEIQAGASNNILSENIKDDLFDGGGSSLDLGILYQIDEQDGYYRWEFGLALMDMGSILVLDAQNHQYDNSDLATALSVSYEDITIDENLIPLFEQFSQDVYQNVQTSGGNGENINMSLPAKLSLQGRYSFNSWAKIDATYISNGTKGDDLNSFSMLAVTPRVDRHWWSVAMPVSLYAGDELRMGLSARLGPLFIGTDQLGSFFTTKELSGADFYVGLKWFPLELRKGKKAKKNKRGSGRNVECYKF